VRAAGAPSPLGAAQVPQGTTRNRKPEAGMLFYFIFLNVNRALVVCGELLCFGDFFVYCKSVRKRFDGCLETLLIATYRNSFYK
jgi:hypothetical protein